MTITKTPRDSQYVTRKIVGPSDLNPHGTLFGGVMMSWMDEVAYCSARKYSGRQTAVTVNIDNIIFLSPVKLGETVVLTSQVNYVGKSSMEIGVKVEKENMFTGELTHTNSAYLTFVAVGKNSKPVTVPRLVLENDEDQRRFEEARIRVKVRNRLKSALKRKLEMDNLKPSQFEVSSELASGELNWNKLKYLNKLSFKKFSRLNYVGNFLRNVSLPRSIARLNLF